MLLYLDGDTYEVQTSRALLLFAKHTALRCNSYVFTNVKTGGKGLVRMKHIRFGPNVFNPAYFILTLPKTKTHQIDAPYKETRTVYCRCDVGPCPVHELAALLRDRKYEPNQALFLLSNGFPVTYRVLRDLLKNLCIAVGIDHRYYPSHSLRIGEATDRNMSGEPLEVTMKFVNWKSRRSAMIYIRPDNEDLVNF